MVTGLCRRTRYGIPTDLSTSTGTTAYSTSSRSLKKLIQGTSSTVQQNSGTQYQLLYTLYCMLVRYSSSRFTSGDEEVLISNEDLPSFIVFVSSHPRFRIKFIHFVGIDKLRTASRRTAVNMSTWCTQNSSHGSPIPVHRHSFTHSPCLLYRPNCFQGYVSYKTRIASHTIGKISRRYA